LLYVLAKTHIFDLQEFVCIKIVIKTMPFIKKQNYQKTTRIFIKIDDPRPQNSPPEIINLP